MPHFLLHWLPYPRRSYLRHSLWLTAPFPNVTCLESGHWTQLILPGNSWKIDQLQKKLPKYVHFGMWVSDEMFASVKWLLCSSGHGFYLCECSRTLIHCTHNDNLPCKILAHKRCSFRWSIHIQECKLKIFKDKTVEDLPDSIK